jgi:hypothetical protein
VVLRAKGCAQGQPCYKDPQVIGTLKRNTQCKADKPFEVEVAGKRSWYADTEFTLKPEGKPGKLPKCAGLPPYPTIGSHAVCVQFGTTGFNWHCPWEFSYAVTDPSWGTCDKVQMDCNDADRILRIINKYEWIQPRTDSFGPEMGCADCNRYARKCIIHQCQNGSDPGANPRGTTRLYSSEMSNQEPTGNLSSMVATFAASALVVVGFVLVVVRTAKARAVDRDGAVIDEESNGEEVALIDVE